MNLGDSGQFFSIITVLLILPLVALSITFGESMRGHGSDIGEQVRLTSSYYHYHSLNEDLVRTSNKVGRRSLLSAITEVVDEGEGLNSSEETLQELFVNGTVDGESHPLMNRSGVDEWLESIERISSERGYEVSLERDQPEVKMTEPFVVSFPFEYSFGMKDKDGMFRLEKEKTAPTKVNIEGLEDPIVALGTGGMYSLTVESCGFEYTVKELARGEGSNSWASGEAIVVEEELPDIEEEEKVLVTGNEELEEEINSFAGAVLGFDVDGSDINVPYVVDEEVDLDSFENGNRVVVEGDLGEAWEVENLYRMWRNSCYMGSGNAPSFMQRLEYELYGSDYGINVLVNKGELEEAGVDVEDRPNPAHIYFSDEDVEKCRVKGMPDSFAVDAEDSTGIVSQSLKFNCE